MSDYLQIGATAIATLIVAVGAAIVGAALQARRDQASWLRDRRVEVCRDFLLLLNDRDFQQRIGTPVRSEARAPADYFAEFEILGMRRVLASAVAAFEAYSPLQAMADEERPLDPAELERLQAVADGLRAAYIRDALASLRIKAS